MISLLSRESAPDNKTAPEFASTVKHTLQKMTLMYPSNKSSLLSSFKTKTFVPVHSAAFRWWRWRMSKWYVFVGGVVEDII